MYIIYIDIDECSVYIWHSFRIIKCRKFHNILLTEICIHVNASDRFFQPANQNFINFSIATSLKKGMERHHL